MNDLTSSSETAKSEMSERARTEVFGAIGKGFCSIICLMPLFAVAGVHSISKCDMLIKTMASPWRYMHVPL
ncbi:hypothetical protein, partial [Rhizobium sp. MHM7A]|uniref:hypothetical protein n=1 Tax=Rhizobium sp. MHM7A TaxID=2583233 RepID=UPI00197CF2E4